MTSHRIPWYLRYSGFGQTSGSMCKISYVLPCARVIWHIHRPSPSASITHPSPWRTCTSLHVNCASSPAKKIQETSANGCFHPASGSSRASLGASSPSWGRRPWALDAQMPSAAAGPGFWTHRLALGHMGPHQTWRNISIHLCRKRCVGEFRTKRGFWDVLGHHVHPQTTRCCSAKSDHLWHHGRTKLPLRHVLLRTVCSPRRGTGQWRERYLVVKWHQPIGGGVPKKHPRISRARLTLTLHLLANLYVRHAYSLPVVLHKAMAEVSKIRNL